MPYHKAMSDVSGKLEEIINGITKDVIHSYTRQMPSFGHASQSFSLIDTLSVRVHL